MRAGMSCVSACGMHCSNGADAEEVSSDEEENDCDISHHFNDNFDL